MENNKTKWRNTIFSRLVITFIIIVFPIYGLSMGIYTWAIQTQREDISKTMLSQTNFYLESLKKEIERIKQLQYYSMNDANLQHLSSIPQSLNNYEKTQSILNLQARLQAIASSSAYIKKVNAYIPAIDRVISSGTYESGIPVEEFNALDVKSFESNDAQLIFWKNRLFLSVAYPAGIPPAVGNIIRKKPRFIISMEFSITELEKALEQFNNYTKGGAVLSGCQNNFRLASTGNDKVNLLVSDFMKKAVKTSITGESTMKIGEQLYWIVYTHNDYLGITLSKYVPESEVLKSFKRYYTWFWIFTIASLFLISLYSFSAYRMIYKPIVQLVNSFRKMEKGDLKIEISHKHNDEFKHLYESFNQMVSKLGMLIDQIYKQKILAQKAQLKQLQMQINPHFLYNSYFILNRMVILEDNENAARFSKQLGTYLKFITRSADDEVTLESEVEHARIYADIQAMRFTSRLELEFPELPADCCDIMVPRLIIQPIIENAIEHGLENKAQGGLLKVAYQKDGDCLDIIIEDNGSGLNDQEIYELIRALDNEDNEEIIETTGSINIHRRLKYRFGKGSGLIFSRCESGGLKVTVRLMSNGVRDNVQAFDS